MATAKLKVYPYVTLDLKGNLNSVRCQAYETAGQVSDSFIYLGLPAIEVDLILPSEDELRAAGVKLIDAKLLEERAKFMAQQTLMQSIRNDLLRLEHADVLDAQPKARVPRGTAAPGLGRPWDDADDIPF